MSSSILAENWVPHPPGRRPVEVGEDGVSKEQCWVREHPLIYGTESILLLRFVNDVQLVDLLEAVRRRWDRPVTAVTVLRRPKGGHAYVEGQTSDWFSEGYVLICLG